MIACEGLDRVERHELLGKMEVEVLDGRVPAAEAQSFCYRSPLEVC